MVSQARSCRRQRNAQKAGLLAAASLGSADAAGVGTAAPAAGGTQPPRQEGSTSMPTEGSAKQSIAVEQSSSERTHAHMPIRAAGAVKCLLGHGLDPNRNPAAATATCDLCRCMGTAYRCKAGCDYEACAACFSGAGSSGAGTSTACCKNASTLPFQRGVCRRA